MTGYLPVYTTRGALVEAGVPVSDTVAWPASRLNRAILRAASKVEQLTAQRFLTYEETIALSGDDRTILMRPDLLPILSVSDVTVDDSLTNRKNYVYRGLLPATPVQQQPYKTIWSSATYNSQYMRLKPQRLPRYMELAEGVFPGGVQNISVTGVMGWPELATVKDTPFVATTTTDITPTSSSVTLTTVDGLIPRDPLLVNGYVFIVTAVNTGTKVASFDPQTGVLGATITAGATAKSFAQIPFGIESCVHLFVLREVARAASWADGSVVDPTQIMEEQTDSYRYKIIPPAQSITFGKSPGLTGIPEYDQILMDHTAPPSIILR